jgi:hypothetical protein
VTEGTTGSWKTCAAPTHQRAVGLPERAVGLPERASALHSHAESGARAQHGLARATDVPASQDGRIARQRGTLDTSE